MKTCLRCQQALPLDAFHSRIHTSKYTGEPARHYTSYCRNCNKQNSKEFRQTRVGLFSLIYSGQVGSSKRRGHPPPDYTKEELIDWITQQPNFEQIYTAWENADFDRWLKPSPDRLDETLPYTLGNLQLITWGENAQSFKQKKVDTGVGDCKPVAQYLDGVVVRTYHSIQEAARQTGAAAGNIIRCCRGEYATSKGFVWRYANE